MSHQGARALVLVTDAYGGRGGIALYIRNLIKGVCEHPGIDRVVAIPRKIFYALEPMPSNLEYKVEASGGKLSYLWNCLKIVFSERSFDLILCTHLHLLPLAWAMGIWYRCPVIPVIYGRDAWKPTSHPFANYLCGKIDTFISIRHLTARKMMEWAGLLHDNYFYLPNCIDRNKYGVSEPRSDLIEKYGLQNKTVIMTSGRLDKGDDLNKGFDEVIEALPELTKRIKNLIYLVMGDGEDRARLEMKATNLGVDDIVIFTGYISESEKADHYRLANVFAMPGSNPEFDRYPYRFVFLEALACGVPVVGASLQDESEINDPDAKLIIQVDPTNSDEIVKGIMKALAQSKREISPIMENYYYEGFRNRLHFFINKIISA